MNRQVNWVTKKTKGDMLVGIKKGIVFKGMDEWRFRLMVKKITIERGKKASIIVVHNNGEDIIEELRKIIEGAVKERRHNFNNRGF